MLFLVFWISSAAWALDCVSLAPGEAARIEGDVGTPIPARYTLWRREDRVLEDEYEVEEGRTVPRGTRVPHYVALVDYDFRNSRGEVDSRLAARYENKTAKCFRKAARKLRGPRGEFLELRLASDVGGDVVKPRRKVVRIDESRSFRSNAAHWEAGPSCAVIVHETLHVLGLVDEYREIYRWAEEGVPKYNCRSLGPRTSIMSSHERAFFAAGLKGLAALFGRDGRSSLIAPAHYHAITAPGCEARNTLYYACASTAYATAAPGAELAACKARVPAECRSEDWVFAYRD
jgi:hypothetical protein